MTRTVLSPVDFDTGEITYQVPTGWNSATLLPLLNTSVAPGLKQWDPDRWTRHRLTEQSVLPSPVLVTAFGHGRHSCPAQPFSLVAMTAAMTHLLREYQMTPGWTTHPQPVPAQIGGVACGRTVSGRLCPPVDRVENPQRVLKWRGRDTSLTPKRMVEREDDAQQQAE
jgi:Cytochrome P450